MSEPPILLYLHGVGDGDAGGGWRMALEPALVALGHPDLSTVSVVAPRYPNGLLGVDDDEPLPKLNIEIPTGEERERHRREFERRRTAMEVMLGRDAHGSGVPGADRVVPAVAALGSFEQARNYVERTEIRSYVLRRVIARLPPKGRLVIVGHSLGSVIAADLIRRLPPGIEVTGMVTIGSPLPHERLRPKGLRSDLSEPPPNLAWWVNFWSRYDPVPSARGVSTLLRWVLDQQVDTTGVLHAHAAASYLRRPEVATAIGFGLFGSRSRELVLADHNPELTLRPAEELSLLALRYLHLVREQLEGDLGERFGEALRQVQAATIDQATAWNRSNDRHTPTSIARLAVDLTDPSSTPRRPSAPVRLSMAEAIAPLVLIASENLLRPFEIEIKAAHRRAAFERLTLEMQLGGRLGTEVFEALDQAHRVLRGPGNRWRWAAIGFGATAILVASGGLALAAAPGVAGAAAVTSALATFGPGGMIGGLLTAGTLVSAGSGSIAVGLAAPSTSAEVVEALVTTQLAAEILRRRQELPSDPTVRAALVETEAIVNRELARLREISDEGATTVKELERKLTVVRRALRYLDPDPEFLVETTFAEPESD